MSQTWTLHPCTAVESLYCVVKPRGLVNSSRLTIRRVADRIYASGMGSSPDDKKLEEVE